MMNKGKKKIILLAAIFGVVGLLSFLTYGIVSKTEEKEAVAQKIQSIPSFEFLTLDKKWFTNNDLESDLNTVLIYFNSECDFCQHEAKSISQNLKKFKEVQFLFASREPIETIEQFSEEYGLNDKPQVTFLYDSLDSFSNHLGASSIPYLLIYDKDQQLVKKHKGQLNASGILKALNQQESLSSNE